MPDFEGVFFLAAAGFIALTLGTIGGIAWLVLFVVNHIAIV
jgi:hypothetical protein